MSDIYFLHSSIKLDANELLKPIAKSEYINRHYPYLRDKQNIYSIELPFENKIIEVKLFCDYLISQALNGAIITVVNLWQTSIVSEILEFNTDLDEKINITIKDFKKSNLDLHKIKYALENTNFKMNTEYIIKVIV